MSESPRRTWLGLAVLIVILDQLTKYLSITYLQAQDTVDIFPGLSLVLRYNTGAAFSFLADASGWQRWFFIGLALLSGVIIYVWLGKLSAKDKWDGLGLSLILGGALGNVIDRLLNGYVVDFILLYYQQWHWPAFNIADTAICIGVALLLPSLFKIPKSSTD